MLYGVMLLWFLLAALSLLFAVIDIRTTPGSPVLKYSLLFFINAIYLIGECARHLAARISESGSSGRIWEPTKAAIVQ